MARIRTVKPEFWASEQIMFCSPLTRLLFIGMWNFCDDNGIHQASYHRIKAEVFPGDNIGIDDIQRLVDELIKNDLLREYAVDNKLFWIIPTWKNHQRIDKPTCRHPLPLSDMQIVINDLPSTQLVLGDHSSNSLQIINDNSENAQGTICISSTTDRNGMDRNGKDNNICEVDTSHGSALISDELRQVFQYWQTVMEHPKAKLDRKRQTKINQALKLGYTVEQLKQAIDGCAKTPFNMGQNDQKQCYDGIGLIFRDAEHIERFIAHSTNIADNPKSLYSIDLMAGVI